MVVFRIFFGLLIFLEAIGACFTGWIKRTLIEPEFTFNFIGLDFLQPLPGNGMYVYYVIMGMFGFLVMLGYRYRMAMISYTIMWAGVYFMQKASYNNHYYLLLLLCGIMSLLPANRLYSLDAKLNPNIKSNSMPNWCRWIFIIQMFIVYTYAAIAKLYPDWWDATFIRNLMLGKSQLYCFEDWCFGSLLQGDVLHKILVYAGFFFDLLVIPMLLWKPTRKLAFFASIVFHIFNAIVFQIGIFPFMSLAFALFFFPVETIKKIFLKNKELYSGNDITIPKTKNLLIYGFGIYFLIQIALPVRHWFIEDNVLWTEEGHRMSWRMMLRSKSGNIQFKIIDNNTGDEMIYDHRSRLSRKQQRIVATKPDVIWQFAQRLKKEFNEKGKNVSIYAVNSTLSINMRPQQPFIDPKVDLANESWSSFKHSHWILPSQPDNKQ